LGPCVGLVRQRQRAVGRVEDLPPPREPRPRLS
jgi:hypothetical protein